MSDVANRVLVVDDEFPITETVARRLQIDKYECTKASSAQQALQELEKQTFGLMVTDISMPDMTGLELLKQCHDMYPDMAVIMLTGISDAETAIESMRQGAFDYLLKPFNFDELILATQRALDHRELRIQNREHQEQLEKKVEERTRHLKQQHKHLKRLHEELQSSFYDTVRVFIGIIELHEPYLGAHVRRVAALSIMLARHFHLSEEDIRTIEMSSLLHDIGLVGISTDLMLKTRIELSTPEFELIKQSPIYGQKVLQSIPRLEQVGKIIRAQHERHDGTGFPDGLKGQDIPYEARLIAVTNAYDAMRFKRNSDKSLSAEAAVAHLEKMRGKQFDPKVVNAFLEALRVDDRKGKRDKPIEDFTEKEAGNEKDRYRRFQYREFMGASDSEDSGKPITSMMIDNLKPGMKTAHPICTASGKVLIARATVLNDSVIEKLRHARQRYAVREPIHVHQV